MKGTEPMLMLTLSQQGALINAAYRYSLNPRNATRNSLSFDYLFIKIDTHNFKTKIGIGICIIPLRRVLSDQLLSSWIINPAETDSNDGYIHEAVAKKNSKIHD